MIKELRIGNWIFDEESYRQVTGIHGNKVYNKHGWCVSESAHPIPLTPEILEKAGFVEGKRFYKDEPAYHNGNYFISDTWFHKKTGYAGANVLNDNIKYLHQLQNIFWILTGEELTINL